MRSQNFVDRCLLFVVRCSLIVVRCLGGGRKGLLILLLLLVMVGGAHAQNQEVYARAKVDLQRQSPEKLAQLGIDLTHGVYAEGRFYINVFSQSELAQIEAAGYTVEIQVPDMAAFLKDPNRPRFSPVTQNCINPIVEGTPYPIPENFELGAMAGYFTYQEMLDQLDSMHQQYPDLITPRTPIEGETTIEGRDIFWVRLSDQASTDEDEPEVLHTALHHSREPGSLSQMIFFMWYLLENYESDPQVQFLVNETAFYFVPCVNPDGYLYNEATNPDGGGFWRKNRRLNDDGSYGVDINRNYGYEWGYNDDGSSPNPESQTYRGESPFSEPETRAIRNFCNAHEFQIALNYHTFGRLLIYPWGFEEQVTPDSLSFESIARAMTRSNQYRYGTDTETLNYTTNGASDDWMYGEQSTKPLIFSMTPEVGAEGFWPAEDRIIPNNLQCMEMNLTSAAALHTYGVIRETNGSFLPDLEGDFYFALEAVGLQPGTFEVRLEAISSNIQSVALQRRTPWSTWQP
jgi:carboxypeptidase T